MAVNAVGIYGGTFDPVHIGHLAVAEEVREAAGLDLVLFVPNRAQPLKSSGPFASTELRLRMLSAATETNPHFAVDPIELWRDGPSYTIDTLDALKHRWQGALLRFMLGTDAANGLPRWRTPQRILREYAPIVMSRAGWPELDMTGLEALCPDAAELVQLVPVPDLAIASSDLRNRIAQGRTVRYLVPDSVCRIIDEAGLYRTDTP